MNLQYIDALSPLVALVVAAGVIMLQDVAHPSLRLSGSIAAAGAAASLILSVYLAPLGLHFAFGSYSFEFTSFTYYFGVVFSASCLLVIFASNYLVRENQSQVEYYLLILAATIGMYLVAAASNLVSLFVSFELATVATYGMTAYSKTRRASGEAAIKYFVIGALSAGIILYAISLIYVSTGTINITSDLHPAQGLAPMLSVAFLLLIAGFGFKVAAVPFHLWLPDTYDGAPYPTTAYLSAASKVMGFAALVRVFLVMGPAVQAATGLNIPLVFGVLALLTMTFGNLAALVQTRVKRMLAYSSIAQSGYILIGLALADKFSYSVLLYFTLAYAISKIGSFIAAGFFSQEYGAETLDEYSLLAKSSPMTAFAFSVLLLSLAGIPPLSVFVAKFFMFYAAVRVGGVWIALAVAGVLNSALSLYYYAKVIKNLYIGATQDSKPVLDHVLEKWMYLVPVVAALVVTIGLGLTEAPVIALASKAVSSIDPKFYLASIERLISL